MPGEFVERTIHGVFSKKPEENGDWFRFSVDVEGNKYPVVVSTKKEDVIEKALALRDEPATFIFVERESDNINPNSGKPYIDRYLNDVQPGFVGEQGGGVHAAARSGGGGGGGSTAGGSREYSPEEIERFDERERRDYASRAWAQTISGFTHTIKTDEDPASVFARLQPFQRKVYADVLGAFGERRGDYLPEALRGDPASGVAVNQAGDRYGDDSGPASPGGGNDDDPWAGMGESRADQ